MWIYNKSLFFYWNFDNIISLFKECKIMSKTSKKKKKFSRHETDTV